MKLYIGTYTKKSSQGIYQADFDQGILSGFSLHLASDNPTYLAKEGDFLFSVVKAGSEGGIAVSRDGKLINQAIEAGAPSCFVSYDAKNGLVYSANYHGGRVNSYTFDETTGLKDRQKIVFPEGSRAHFIKYEPVLDEVLVCDLGLDKVYFFKVDETGQLILAHTFEAQAKTGPRHLVVHPDKPLVYVFTELSSEVLVLRRTETSTELIQTVSALPEGVEAQKWGAAIRMSPDARYLYVSNRGHDSLSVFAVTQDGEHLDLIQNVPTYGIQPRDFNLSPSGEYVLVANHDTDNLSVFKRDVETGLLTLMQKDIWAPEGVCVIFEK